MAAAMALQLRINKIRSIRNPSFSHLFSSSTSAPKLEDQNTTTSSSSQSSFSSYFSDIKSSLKQQTQPRKQFSPSSAPLSTEKPPSKIASLEEIRKNLSDFRRSVVPPPGEKQISFQEIYKRNLISKTEESSNGSAKGGKKLSFEAIRESLRQVRSNNQVNSKFTGSFNLRPVGNARESPVMIGGTGELPVSVFGKEMRDEKLSETDSMKLEFVKMYSYGELGEKLRMLRPEIRGENWFSLRELNERLMKLREIEEEESESRIGGVAINGLRESLLRLRMLEDEKARKSSIYPSKQHVIFRRNEARA